MSTTDLPAPGTIAAGIERTQPCIEVGRAWSGSIERSVAATFATVDETAIAVAGISNTIAAVGQGAETVATEIDAVSWGLDMLGIELATRNNSAGEFATKLAAWNRDNEVRS